MKSRKKTKEEETAYKPRYRRITDTFRQRLDDGSWAPGTRLPALNDLAKQFSVSTTTIRNALKTLEREGCLYHIHSVGSFVRPNYPSQSETKEITVAFVTFDLSSPFDMGLARGIQAGCQERGWGIQILDAQQKAEQEVRNILHLPGSKLDGAIILPSCVEDSIEALFKLKLSKFPFVLLDRSVPGLKIDLVESDHEKGACQATNYLLHQGYPYVLIVTPRPTISSIVDRIRGYDQALLDHGLDPLLKWKLWTDPETAALGVKEGRRWLQGYEVIKPALKTFAPPLAIFAMEDYTGWGVYVACRERGLRIPEDVSIISFDDSDISQAMIPPMTAVAQRHKELGQKAVELLERRLRYVNAEAEHVIVDVDLIKRKSVLSLAERHEVTA